MNEIIITGNSLPEAYHNALLELQDLGIIAGCSDWNTQQKEAAMTVMVSNPLLEPRISKLIIGGSYDLQRYVMELVDGILDFKIGKGWDYTYHDRFAKYLPFVIEELQRNPESRRAVISIRDNEIDTKIKDAACMQSIQYFIRDNKLDCMVLFRSNDLLKAFFFNAFALIILQEKIAGELGVEVGTYTHRSNSMHCYGQDFAFLERCVKAIKNNDSLTYHYKDEWKDIMEEEIPGILKLVEGLKSP